MDIMLKEGLESRKKRIGARIKTERKRLDLTQEKFAEKLTELLDCKDITQNTVSNWESGKNLPPTERIIAMSMKFGCDCGYLLCDYEQRTHNSVEMCKATGLSELSVQVLCSDNSWGFTDNARVIDFLLFDAVRMKPTHHFRSILDLLHFFFGYKNHSKMKKSVSINGSVYDDNTTDGTISKNAIAINDRVIENAVLMEIQQALISLKQDYWQWANEGDAKRNG